MSSEPIQIYLVSLSLLSINSCGMIRRMLAVGRVFLLCLSHSPASCTAFISSWTARTGMQPWQSSPLHQPIHMTASSLPRTKWWKWVENPQHFFFPVKTTLASRLGTSYALFISALLTFLNPAPVQGVRSFPSSSCLSTMYSWHPGHFLFEKCSAEACDVFLGLLQDSPSQFHPRWQAAGISWPGSISGCPPSSWPPQRRSNICPRAAATRGDTAHMLSLWVDRGNI